MQTKVRMEPMLLAGEWVERDQTIDVFDPGDGRLLARVPSGSTEDMLEAIDRAEEAFLNTENWSTKERMDVLQKAAAFMEDHKETFALTIASEGSKTITEAKSEVTRAIETIRLSAEEARRINGETINFDQRPGSENRVGYYYRFPIGVIGAITPFNDPLNLVAHKVGPAIAAGNAIVVKPASVTPLSALLLAEALLKAGLPKGFLSIITGPGREVGGALINHPSVKMVSFTGGLEAGQKISRQAGLKKVNMELGSNSPVVVFEDADISDAVEACVSGAFSAVGQNCIGVQRIYVERGAYESFLKDFVGKTAELKVGRKMDEQTDVGPLIQEREAERVEEWVEEALLEGATLKIGGSRQGNFYMPTILTDVPDTARIAKEEIFGPVVLVYPFNNASEVVKAANNVDYGLHAGVFTESLEKAYYMIKHLEAGGVMINDSSDYRVDAMPFGGVKGSGIGREGIKSAIEAMTEPKVVCFRLKGNVV
ncbi:aldehyde dehydrogenase family protein [Sediminibacillus massiliensis]|uniref:aldehyde dehydrogenase family protein n=1 Tax=Sediminibacillus massiliensis TaxID=1926277 RepID=UPI0009886CFC|nr:aldehyde dehydrogenase family protein [Sediminibacillus massiliensis]